MIKISISKKNDIVDQIVIKGHAEYEENGKDIVCASVSSICATTINAILRINDKSIIYEENDAFIQIDILNHDKITDILLLNMIELFSELEKQYPKNIKL